MTNPIDFYFDFSSPYGYFAATKIDGLVAKYGRTVAWRPILLGVDKNKLIQALNDPAVKERLKTEVNAAIERGVFGSPYIVVDGEPFWGSDRLDQVEKWLDTGGW